MGTEGMTGDPVRRPTIIDVARRAGVSKSLASRALRGEPGVSEARRDVVVTAAADLGYRLNSAARSLVQGVSGLIGVVLNEIGNQHHTSIVTGIEQAAAVSGTRVIIGNGRHDPQELSRQIDTMLELRVDGLIIISSWVAHDVLARTGREVPTVVVTQLEHPPEEVDTIASDDVVGAALAVDHFVAVGRERIAYVTRSTSPTSRARVRGAREAAVRSGLRVAVFELDPEDSAGLRDIVVSRAFDAILCNNDITAAEVIRCAQECCVLVPDQLALIGYDNTVLASLLAPSLSSVDQPQLLMGRRATEALRERMEAGREEPLRELYAPTLVVRESTPH